MSSLPQLAMGGDLALDRALVFMKLSLAKAMAVVGLYFFGGALLTAAEDPIVSCRIQYYYEEFDVALRCYGDCPTDSCLMLTYFEGDRLTHTCFCADGTVPWCRGALVQGEYGYSAICLEPEAKCGWHLEFKCRSYFNPDEEFADACRCDADG